jgi:hypothetical protein
MNRNSLFEDLTNATESLLTLARSSSYNKISSNCLYILSEIPKGIMDSESQRKLKAIQNRQKQPVELAKLIPDLELLYPNLHDINLLIYRAESNLTIVDIRYFARKSLEEDYRKLVEDNPPFLVSKVAFPPYHDEGQKIDINWETGNLRHQWNMFILRFKVRKLTREMNKKIKL